MGFSRNKGGRYSKCDSPIEKRKIGLHTLSLLGQFDERAEPRVPAIGCGGDGSKFLSRKQHEDQRPVIGDLSTLVRMRLNDIYKCTSVHSFWGSNSIGWHIAAKYTLYAADFYFLALIVFGRSSDKRNRTVNTYGTLSSI